MTICMVISLLKIPYIHRIFVYMYGEPYYFTIVAIACTALCFAPLLCHASDYPA